VAGAVFGLLLSSLSGLAGPTPARADPPPDPLLWQRKLVSEYPQSDQQVRDGIVAECQFDLERGLRENFSGGPKIATLGDSVQSQMRAAAMGDVSIHWAYASHCGEKFGTAVDSGRAGDAANSGAKALVIGLGGNDLSDFWQVKPSLLPKALYDFGRLMDATSNAPCRVLYTLPEVPPWFATTQKDRDDWMFMTAQLNGAIRNAAQTRPGVRIADWAQRVSFFWPAYLQDGMHLTRLGINEKVNLALETARGCWEPDTPTNIGVVPGNGNATVWWDPLPAPEQVLFYKVTASDGRSVNSVNPTVNFPGLTNGVPIRFEVRAVSFAGISTPTVMTAPVTPSATGSRFTGTSPVRVLDTRFGTGGKSTAFGPAETYRLSLAGVVPPGTSAVVMNITATGQSSDTFITAFPGGQTRPLTSNLNPRPGVAAVPAMVTTRVGVDGSINLFNNSGSVHLIADIIGWYGAPGDSTGALYGALTPVRVLDTRTGTGNKSTPFGAGEQHVLDLPVPDGASAAVLNVTSTDTTGPTHVTLWPDGQPQPVASSLNPQAGLTRANLTTSAIGAGKKVRIYNNSATTNLVIDMVGYYSAPGVSSGGSQYFPITPERLYDTRDGTGGVSGPVTNGSPVALAFTGKGSVPPSNVSAIDANVTIVDPNAHGHTTIWPTGSRPDSSVLNYMNGEVIANRDYITLSGAGALFWSAAPSIHHVVDVTGWFGPTL